MNLDFGKAAISVVSDLAHLGAVNALGSKSVSSDVHEMVSLKKLKFFIVGEPSFCGSQAHSRAVNLVCWFLSTKSAKMYPFFIDDKQQ
jgi:hypothetical protein